MVLACFYLACQNEAELQILKIKSKVLPPDFLKNMQMTYFDSGLVSMSVKAAELVFLKTDKKENILKFNKGLELFFYHLQEGTIKNTLKGDYGFWQYSKGLIEIRYNVKVLNEKGDTLWTEELFWNKSRKQIYTDKLVTIQSPNKKIWGMGLEANEDFSIYKIKKIKGYLNIPKKDTLTKAVL